MSTCWNRFCGLIALFAFLAPAFRLVAEPPPDDWNVAVLDQILASVPPGSKLARVGDMDILVSNLKAWRDQLAGGNSPNLAFDGTAPTWPGGNLYYTFDSSVSVTNQKVFLDGAQEWATFANLHFIPRTTQPNYFTVMQQTNLEGGQSAVGMVGGQQFLQIGPTAWNRGTICHELGHTLGLVHEQQRSDRDIYVVILTNNIIPGTEGNFVKLGNSRNQGAYDFQCIMHYARNALSIDPSLDTIEPQPAYSQFLNLMGHSDPVLTALDRAGMAAVYGAGPTPSSVVTNTQATGPGSLDAALFYGFDHPGTTITFNIPVADPGFSNNVFNIQPTDELPALLHATTIDGSTEPTNSNPNGPSILLNGALAPVPSVFPAGLHLMGTNCVVRSLIVNGFPSTGIYIDGTNATGNKVQGCYLGLDPTGNIPVTNGFPPLTIANGASFNTIGGTNAAARNVMSGSAFQGMIIRDPGSRSNVVEGNYIGLNAAGTFAVSNTWAGVNIFNGAQSNIIGGTVPGTRNILSGNGNQGAAISGPGSTGNVVEGNYMGLNPAGTAAIPNGWTGIDIFGGAQFNRIGGLSPSMRNVISGNTLQGVVVADTNTSGNVIEGNYIGVDPTGTNAIGNGWAGVNFFGGASDNLVGGTSPGAANIISGNGTQGVLIQDPSMNNTVQGNLIGLNALGNAAVPNAYAGVGIAGGAQSNLVGGTVAGAANVLSGNASQGVTLADPGTAWNLVQGNLIGVDPTGTNAIGNVYSGVGVFNGCQSNLVGGPLPSMRNLISGNLSQGVLISDPGTSGNLIEGNYIGVNPAGTAAIPNNFAGVEIFNGPVGNYIGTTAPGTGNVISGNRSQGIYIHQNTDSNIFVAASNVVQGNFIGLGASGLTVVPNGFSGVEIASPTQGNVVGGGAGARNYISGNLSYGVNLDFGSTGSVVQGNSIGLNLTNGPAPNAYAGVAMYQGSQSNYVGGTTLGAANLIAFNSDGIDLYDSTTIDNSFRGNSIFSNTGSGINLYTGSNLSEPAPVLTNAVLTTNLTVSGNLASTPATTFHLDFYASPPPANSAQATTYLGAKDVATGGGGTVNFAAGLGAIVPAGQIIAATATDPDGNTSALSSGFAVTAVSSVNDGIPDAWRAAHFGGSGATTNSQSCAACDPDHDGMSNYQEFLAGTNPTNAASALRIAGLADNGTDITVNFQSTTGIVYRVEFRDDIVTGGWSVLADQIIGSGGLLQVTNPGVAILPRRFYRLGVLP